MMTHGVVSLVLPLTIVLTLPAFPVHPAAHAGTGGEVRGPAFSDPSYRLSMPEGWGEQPIVYKKWAAGADLAVTLDQHLYGALLPFIQEFAASKGVRIAVKEGTCGISAGLLARRQVDMGGFCCPPGGTDRLPGLRYHTLGAASLAILVNAANEIENITADQARAVFRGDFATWDEVGGEIGRSAGTAVQPVLRLHCKARPGHWRLILADEDLFGPQAVEVGSIPDMLASIAGRREAVGYEVLWNLARYKYRGKVKPLSIDGLSPRSTDPLAEGRYPFYRIYSVTTWDRAHGGKELAGELKDYLHTRLGEIEGSHHFIPVSVLREAGWSFSGEEVVGEPGGPGEGIP